MHQGHRLDAIFAVEKNTVGGPVLDVLRLQVEQAHDDLQIVLHPVVYLFQQGFLLGERGGDLRRRPLSLGDVARGFRDADDGA